MSFTLIQQATPRLHRSELAVPGSNPSLFEKAAKGAADIIFLDLEDAVAPDDKEQARKNIIQGLNDLDWGKKTMMIRINGLDTHYAYRDVVDVVVRPGRVSVGSLWSCAFASGAGILRRYRRMAKFSRTSYRIDQPFSAVGFVCGYEFCQLADLLWQAQPVVGTQRGRDHGSYQQRASAEQHVYRRSSYPFSVALVFPLSRGNTPGGLSWTHVRTAVSKHCVHRVNYANIDWTVRRELASPAVSEWRSNQLQSHAQP